MSASADKARYFLEQSVPQLQELLRKSILSESEVKAIVKKRSDFEHTINARGQSASDYAEYAAYEINLAALIGKRCQRKRVKLGVSAHDEARRVSFILRRGVKRFQGDLALWMQYLTFTRKQGSRKKMKELLTEMLRLHVAKSAVWIYAARWAMEEEGDMAAAREYMMRGLRFCKRDWEMWVKYAQLECAYIAKIAARRKILGLDGTRPDIIEAQEEGDEVLKLAPITAEDLNPELSKTDEEEAEKLKALENTPALTGAIPIAIFEAAMTEFDQDSELAGQMFKIISGFERSPAFEKILTHVTDTLVKTRPDSIHTIACRIMLPVAGRRIDSPDYPRAIAESLGTIRQIMQQTPARRTEIADLAIQQILPIAMENDLDEDMETALVASLKRWIKVLDGPERTRKLVKDLERQGKHRESQFLTGLCKKVYPTEKEPKARVKSGEQQKLSSAGD